MRHVIALGVSDTGTRAALVGPDGTPLYEEWRAVGRGAGPEAAMEELLPFAEELRARGRDRFGTAAEAVGVAVPGAVPVRGTEVGSGGLRRAGIRERLSRGLRRIPVVLAPEVRAAALAEGRLGAGRGAGRFLFVSLDGRVAGAIGTDRGIETGAHDGAGAIGHVVVRPGGPVCGCGRRGCLDAVASAAAIARSWAAASGAPVADAIGCARAAGNGDAAAAEVWQAAVEALADGLITAHTLLDSRTLIIGGGLAAAGETLFAPLRAAVRKRIAFRRLPGIVPAALGDTAGCLGAGLLARDLLAVGAGR
ncbi:ROK family protein [Streptomyces tanashiensis]|uniref:ROK family protein n=1 Tax=Streptomyces tanashiensis TaxID=67367 RepID=UPI0033E92D8C